MSTVGNLKPNSFILIIKLIKKSFLFPVAQYLVLVPRTDIYHLPSKFKFEHDYCKGYIFSLT